MIQLLIDILGSEPPPRKLGSLLFTFYASVTSSMSLIGRILKSWVRDTIPLKFSLARPILSL
jgi:hypothetical protein